MKILREKLFTDKEAKPKKATTRRTTRKAPDSIYIVDRSGNIVGEATFKDKIPTKLSKDLTTMTKEEYDNLNKKVLEEFRKTRMPQDKFEPTLKEKIVNGVKNNKKGLIIGSSVVAASGLAAAGYKRYKDTKRKEKYIPKD